MSRVTAVSATGEAAAPYEDGIELIRDLLARLDVRLKVRLEEFQEQVGGARETGLLGLVVTDDEVRRALAAEPERGAGVGWSGSLWEEVAPRLEATLAEDRVLPFQVLAQRFGLEAFELDCLLVCLAVEVEARYAKVFGYLNDDLTRKYPTVDLLLRLCCPQGAERERYGHYLVPQAPLLESRLLAWASDAAPAQAVPRLGRCLRVEPGVAQFLLEEPFLDPDLEEAGVRRTVLPAAAELWATAPAKEALAGRLAVYFEGLQGGAERSRTFVLCGRPGSGRAHAAVEACADRGLAVLGLDCRRVLRAPDPEALLAKAFCHSALRAAPLLLERFDALEADPQGPALALQLDRLAATHGWLVFVCVERAETAQRLLPDQPRTEIVLGEATSGDREAWWRRLIGTRFEVGEAEAGRLAAELAVKFRLTPGQLAEAVDDAADALANGNDAAAAGAGAKEPGGGTGLRRLLHASAARVAAPALARLAQRLEPLYGWDDIVLPPARRELLRDVVRRVHHRRTVAEEWDFDRAMRRARGLNVLFSGPPGTGKTMAAEVVANELAMELYRIDLASVVSKYIGETEKNLARIFDEAEHSDAILFFDEADALFGKRSQVRDAHDRYANIEISYLLQRMEAFDGVAVLATNLRQNLDDAFLRRLQIVIEFPLPDPEDRLRIWRRLVPRKAPLGPDVDLGFLARGFDLAGGGIRNVVVTAAFLAAEEGGPITMRHLVQATRRELEKSGKRPVKEHFGPFAALLDAAPADPSKGG